MLKQWISYALCLVLILSLSGCAQESQPTEDPRITQLEAELAQAKTCMENGDYESAVAILNNITLYRQITDTLSEAEAGRQAQMLLKYDPLFGKTWYAVDRNMEITFHQEPNQDGELTMAYLALVNEQGSFVEHKGEIPYTVDHGGCTLAYFSDFDSISAADVPVYWLEQDGRTVLYLGALAFVSEESAKPSGVEMVEITMDNWQEYFEIKTVEIWETDDFGDVSNLIIGTYIALKEKYLDCVDLKNSDVTIGYRYDWKLINCTLNPEDLSYKLGSLRGVYGPQEDTFVMPDRLGHYSYNLPDYLGGFYYGSFDPIMNVISEAADYQITKIAGTLAIR